MRIYPCRDKIRRIRFCLRLRQPRGKNNQSILITFRANLLSILLYEILIRHGKSIGSCYAIAAGVTNRHVEKNDLSVCFETP